MVFFSSVLWGLCGGGFVRGVSLVVYCGVCVEEGSLGGFL